MLHDAGSWHFEFNELVAAIREKLLALAGVSRAAGFEAIRMVPLPPDSSVKGPALFVGTATKPLH